MCALYAFLRITDDLTDGPGSTEEKEASLTQWRHRFDQAMTGSFRHRLHPALVDTIRRYHLPQPYLEAVLDGVAMDLRPVAFETFADLYPYCYRVASAVGLCCIHIWGFTDKRAIAYAEAAGIAFQLTNILRDLAEDASRGRVYLPREELRRFGYTLEELRRGDRTEGFRALMEFQVERARTYYRSAWPLLEWLRPAGRAIFPMMMRTYSGLLDAIEQRQYDVFSSRVRLSRWHKLTLAMQSLPLRFGWE
jgi:phytoene synthase